MSFKRILLSEVFGGSREPFFKKVPWPPEAKKKSGIAVVLVLFMGLGILLAAPSAWARQAAADLIRVDKIAAEIDDEIITLLDIEKAIRFYPAFRGIAESEEDFYVRVLNDLINYKVVFLEYRKEFTLREEDYNEVQTAVIDKLGSLEKLMAVLQSYDMEWVDFKDFIKEKVIFEKVLEKQLQGKIPIDFKEIEAFYQKEYVPMQKQLELEPRSLIEMAPQIENHLRKVRMQKELAEWLKELRSSYTIENKLGIVQ